MEGRKAPPKASAYFYNGPLDTSKFFGTPIAKGLYKFSLALFTIIVAVNGTNFYLTRNQTHYLGQKVIYTPEEASERMDMKRRQGKLVSLDVGIDLPTQDIFPTAKDIEDPRLDDRVVLVAGAHNPTPFGEQG